jgi:hypothetical protein
MATTNTFGINYTDKKLHILFNGETHVFDLTEGDLPDYWNGFVTKDGRVWDVNFFQEDETCEPSVSVYPAVWVGDENGSYEIDTSEEHSLQLVARTGTAKEYFEAWNADSIVTKPLQEGDLIGGRFRVKKVTNVLDYPEHVKDIKKALADIITKINDNGMSAWNADLENTVEAVACEDYYGDVEQDEPTVTYNGWYEDLIKLSELVHAKIESY